MGLRGCGHGFLCERVGELQRSDESESPAPQEFVTRSCVRSLNSEAAIGALIIRMGFRGILYYIIIIRSPENSIGNYLGPYITLQTQAAERRKDGTYRKVRIDSYPKNPYYGK